jgi:hypothetical protein
VDQHAPLPKKMRCYPLLPRRSRPIPLGLGYTIHRQIWCVLPYKMPSPLRCAESCAALARHVSQLSLSLAPSNRHSAQPKSMVDETMKNVTNEQAISCLWLLVLSVLFVLGNFLWQGHDGFNLWDEGYLWYGARQVMAGEIPIRDFMAYDPGRYYWAAAYFSLTGNTGIIALRISVAIFQILGIYAGLRTISRPLKRMNVNNLLFLCICAITLMAWAYPRHKIFDISISMILTAGLAHLLAKPSGRRYLELGVLVGLAAVFGRNHGVYGAAGSLIAIAWLTINSPHGTPHWKWPVMWAIGVVIGYLPVLSMCIFVPGYFSAFVDTIVFMLEQGNTNLPLPVPWPWTVGFGTAGFLVETRWFLIGLCFMALIGFGSAALLWLFRERIRGRSVSPALVAVACVSLPYAHFAFARADVGHLAQAIYPLLIGYFVILSVRDLGAWKIVAGALAATLSVFIMANWQPGILAYTQAGWQKVEVTGSSLNMDPSTAEAVTLLRDMTDSYARDGRAVLVLPFWPGAYPLLGRHAPLWEIYALSPRSEEFQLAEIERIKKADPGFALIFDLPMDGREELRFSKSHSLIDDYIRSHFEAIPNSVHPALRSYKAESR